ncbi:hypothetical protein [Mycobacterium paragordonae]|uniref:hypothetical protein n=1 Tax=Mycobacterium paragordonae TaxID=1389713 RepID=UPI00105DE0C6|nr:hypothetical protein [Mycobacterium paragordonae]TDK98136.1 hypothetical protein EUA05_31435 [Mycobacterium paragordonae]
MTTIDPWTSSDHDPLSQVEQVTPKQMTLQTISGARIAEYPDFVPGAAVRVLPSRVSNEFPVDRRIVDDSWTFVGRTRHAEYATIRHTRDAITVTIERDRLQHRP